MARTVSAHLILNRSSGAAGATAPEWDQRVDSWDDVSSSAAFRQLAETVERLAAPLPDDRVVDLGAGTGLLTLGLASAVENVTAVDASQPMLDRLEEKARAARLENVTPVVADLRSLPLADESATLAVSNYAFHHLDDPGKELALSEARRVLAPGGRLVLCDMMFSLSLRGRDRAVIAGKLRLLAARGPAGLLRIGKNAVRIARGSWERPASPECWEDMLRRRHFDDVSVQLLAHEAAVACARRPEPANVDPPAAMARSRRQNGSHG